MRTRRRLLLVAILAVVATGLLGACSNDSIENEAVTPEGSAATTAEPDASQTPETPATSTPEARATPEQGAESFGGSFSEEGADSPEGAVRLLLEGISENDQDKVLDATDPEFRNNPFGPANLGLLGQALFSILTGARIDQPKISFRDIRLTTQYEGDPSFATVYLSGRVRAFGQEDSLSNEPTPAVKKYGRWFVTSEEGSYAGQIKKRQEEEERARREQEEAERQRAEAEAKAKAERDRIELPNLVSVSLGPTISHQECPGTYVPSARAERCFDAQLTVANQDDEEHTYLLRIRADLVCAERQGSGTDTAVGVRVPGGQEVTANVGPAWADTYAGYEGGFSMACDWTGTSPIDVRFSISCSEGIDDFNTANFDPIAIAEIPVCEGYWGRPAPLNY